MGLFVFYSEVNNWFWVLVVGCLLGGVLGVLLYIVFIEMYYVLDNDGEIVYEF